MGGWRQGAAWRRLAGGVVSRRVPDRDPPIIRLPAAAAPPVAPGDRVGPVPPSQWPAHAGPIVADAIAAGMGALAAAPGVILLGCGGVMLLRLPSDLSQFALLDTVRSLLEQVLKLAQAVMDDPNAMTAGAASIDAQDNSGGLCGGALLDLFVASPFLAGVLVAAARAVGGRAVIGDLAAGFRRWPAVLLAMVILCVAGTGMPIVAPLVGGIAWAAALPPAEPGSALAGAIDPTTMEICGLVGTALVLLPIVWGSSRLWFAIVRAADPERPPLAGHSCVAWSWRATRGCQGGLFVLAMLLFALACALAVPLRMVALQSAPAGAPGWAGAAAWVLASMLALPVVAAVSGAAYSILADAHEPLGPSRQPALP